MNCLLSFDSPHAPVCADLSLTDNLLQAPNLDVNCISPSVFHPILSSQNYENNIKLNDLSYAVVNEFGYFLQQLYQTDREIGPLRERIRTISRVERARVKQVPEYSWQYGSR